MNSIYTSLHIQRNVIFALFVRELKTRFGIYRLGYFWAILEPLIHTGIILVIFGIRSTRVIPGVDYPVFLITGLVPFFMFRNVVSKLMSAVDANKGLFNYKRVTPFNAIMARLVLEGVIYFIVYVLLISGASLIYDIKIQDPLGLISIYAILYIFSFSVGVIACIITTLYTESKKFVPIIMHPLYFISAVLYPVSIVSERYQHWLLWNPLVHVMELSRTSFFAAFTTKTGNIYYLLLCTIAVLILGLSLYRLKRTEVLASS